jgi:GcrA cell cycle regulator
VKKETVKKESVKKESEKTVAKKEANNKTAEKKSESKTSSSSAKTLAMHQRIVQHSLEMASLKPNQCRWPIGDPDSEHFHFCGETVFVGKPYCYEHCKQAYQFTPPKKK